MSAGFVVAYRVRSRSGTYLRFLEITGRGFRWIADRDRAERFASPEAARSFLGVGRRDRRIEILEDETKEERA